ncbi:MAG TPA: hypothetical protein VFJ43_02240 [Bacteroidia bacterium]|nr:hypothetical protein [Bacteroidia bacterium]
MINNIIGRPVTIIGIFFGYIILAGSCVLIFLFGFFPSILLLLVSLFIVSVVQGVQVDPMNKKIRSYISFLGIKKGKWEELENFPFICVLRKNKELEADSLAQTQPIIIKSVQYEICLLNHDHFIRMLLLTVNKIEDAKRVAEEYSTILKKPIVEFHPKRISERRR